MASTNWANEGPIPSEEAEYFQKLSSFLSANPAGTLDLNALANGGVAFKNFSQAPAMDTSYPNVNLSPPEEDASSPESSHSVNGNARRQSSYEESGTIMVPPMPDNSVIDLTYANGSRQNSSEYEEQLHQTNNANGKRAGQAAQQGALKDRRSSTNKSRSEVHHTHEQQEDEEEPAPKNATKKGKKGSTVTSDKRKEQNRNAQRAFRERKENYARTLEAQVADLEAQAAARETENQHLKELVNKLQSENAQLSKSQSSDFTFNMPMPSTSNLSASLPSSASYPIGSDFAFLSAGSSFFSAQQPQPTLPLSAPLPQPSPSSVSPSATVSVNSASLPASATSTANDVNALSDASIADLLEQPSIFTPRGEHLNIFDSMPLLAATAASPSSDLQQAENALSPGTTAALFNAYRETASDPLNDLQQNGSNWNYNDLDDLFGLKSSAAKQNSPLAALSPSASVSSYSSGAAAISPFGNVSTPSDTSANPPKDEKGCVLLPLLQSVKGSNELNIDQLCKDLTKKATCTDYAKKVIQNAVDTNQDIDAVFESLGHQEFRDAYSL